MPANSEETLEAIKVQQEHKKLILSGEMTWSSGPKTINHIVDKFKLHKYVLPWNSICSCFCHHVSSIVYNDVNYKELYSPKVIDRLGKNNEYAPDNMFGIHLWNECWRRNGMDKNGSFHKNSIYEELKERYLFNNVNDANDTYNIV